MQSSHRMIVRFLCLTVHIGVDWNLDRQHQHQVGQDMITCTWSYEYLVPAGVVLSYAAYLIPPSGPSVQLHHEVKVFYLIQSGEVIPEEIPELIVLLIFCSDRVYNISIQCEVAFPMCNCKPCTVICGTCPRLDHIHQPRAVFFYVPSPCGEFYAEEKRLLAGAA